MFYFGTPAAGEVFIIPLLTKGNPKSLTVVSVDAAGKAQDVAFYLSVVCPIA
jgi:hypothetical protein